MTDSRLATLNHTLMSAEHIYKYYGN